MMTKGLCSCWPKESRQSESWGMSLYEFAQIRKAHISVNLSLRTGRIILAVFELYFTLPYFTASV